MTGPLGPRVVVSPLRAMSIIMPPFGGHVHIEYHNHSYHCPHRLRWMASHWIRGSRGLPYESSSLAHPSPLRGPLPLKGTQERYGIYFSVSYDMISILVISRCAAPPYPAAPDFPPFGGQNKSLYAFLQRHAAHLIWLTLYAVSIGERRPVTES